MFTIHNSWITNNYDKESLPEIYQFYIQLYNWIQSSYYAKFRIKVYPETVNPALVINTWSNFLDLTVELTLLVFQTFWRSVKRNKILQ